jgi:acyl-CoA synthetase (AMP-forming)/AMP-acid ligase II
VNLAVLLTMAADAMAGRCALSGGGLNLEYGELRDAAAAFAMSLPPEAGTVVYAGPISAATPIALFGSAWAGRSFAPLNYRLPVDAFTPLAVALAPAQAVASPDRFDALQTVLPGARRDEDLLAGRTESQRADPIESPDRPAVLLYTSGTSAAPKAAALGHDNLLSYIWNTVELAAAGDDEAALVAVPSFHIAGIAALISNVYAGRRIIPMPSFNAEAWLRCAREEHVTHAFLVPTMLARIVEHAKTHPEPAMPALRVLSYGGARMPLPVLEEALRLFPATDFVNAYGLTETSSTVALLTPEDHRRAREGDQRARQRLGSVGRPIPGIEIQVVDEMGRTRPEESEGGLRIRGNQVGGTYLDGTASTGDDGWLVTGDRGRIDADGYVWVLGREDDVVIRGGENITPAEIEDLLLRHRDIAQSAVIGLPDAEWGEQVAAVVVTRHGRVLSADDVREHVREHLGSLKTPTRVAFVADLPMTPSGKVLRRAVREQLLEDLETEGASSP